MRKAVIRSSSPRRAGARCGFTLIETALATLIVGVGIVATMQLFASCTQQNQSSAQMTTAMLLTTNIQEMMGGLTFIDPGTATAVFGPETGESLATYDDVDDFDGRSFNPPVDSMRQEIPDLSHYTQVVSVWPVYPSKLSVNSDESSPDIAKTVYTGAVRVRVRILHRASELAVPAEVYRASWVRVDR